ncbi:putative hydroxymethylpyrimidine transporter CytX [uncultured Secundilactobacillus sp.]|uniref:putative hydroxymethylpyrimidine transporter CytX n=1 Tax=uncultured Secundilactobacillus sp. TaxID=2813935 RepID=UPI002583B49B|nr:putative hydroxymethylpyrimidine transporter CytX [uncultured Secundilactobacillus sp.]
MERTKMSSAFLLWLGAAISIAEIVTGTLMAPLGLQRGVTAIILGHLIGCGLFLLPAAYLSATHNQTAIAVTHTTFGRWGVSLFSILNAVQLLGWTAVMIVNAQLAMNEIAKRLFHFQSAWLMAVIVAILIVIWLMLDHQWLFTINNVVVVLLAIGMVLVVWAVETGHSGGVTAGSGTMSFGSAVELNVTMALSWLPLIGDYTRNTTTPFKASLVSVSGYFLGSVAMFLIGLLTVLKTGLSDFTAAVAQTNLGLIALLIIVFSTVTTTFMDAYSAATNIDNLLKSGRTNLIGVLVTGLGLVVALMVSMAYYQNFLSAIGAVFTPLFAIVFVSIFGLRQRLALGWNFAWWVVGVLAYSWLQRLDFVLGTTVLLLVGLSLGVYLTSLFVRKYPLLDKDN